MKALRNWRFQHKLNLLVSVTMVSILIATNLFLFINHINSYKAGLFKSYQVSVEQIGENLDSQVYFLKRVTFSVLANRQISEYIDGDDSSDFDVYQKKDDKIHPLIISYTNSWSQLSGLYLFDLFGKAYYTSNFMYPDNTYDVEKSAWYQSLGKNLEENYDNSFVFVTDNKENGMINSYPTLSVVRTLKDIDSAKRLGFVRADMKLDNIKDDILGFLLNGKDIYYQVKDENNSTFLTNYNDNEFTPKSNSFQNTDAMQNMLIDGEYYTPIYYKLENAPWTLIYYIPYSNIYKEIIHSISFNIIITLLGVIIILFCTFLISSDMTKTMKNLIKTMKLVEKGDLNVRSSVDTDDEIGMLCKSFNQMVGGMKELIQRVYKAEIISKESSIKALQAQINPHFFFNTLESIDSIAMEEGNETISNIVRSLASGFRYAMKGEKYSTIKQELQHVKEYVSILQIKYPGKFDFLVEVDSSLLDISIPKLTLQPIVENAVMHGVLKKRGKGSIGIFAERCSRDEIEIKIGDNGVGISEEQMRKINNALAKLSEEDINEHIGLVNVNNTLKYFFGHEFGIRLINGNNGGLTAIIKLAVTKHD